jgi:hypothetical protein
MRSWSDRVWIAEAPLRFYGVPFGTRMTVVRLAGGGLWVHSPLDPVPPLRTEIDALGPVRYVVSPNKLHHLFLGAFHEAYPSAKMFAPPGLQKKRPDLGFNGVLGGPGPDRPAREPGDGGGGVLPRRQPHPDRRGPL